MKILRVIARLNVGGPARHVVWLTEGLKSMGHETVLIAGVVPPGEDDMNYFAETAGIKPLTIRELSRGISPKDFLAAWTIYRRGCRRPHRWSGVPLADPVDSDWQAPTVSFRAHFSWSCFS